MPRIVNCTVGSHERAGVASRLRLPKRSMLFHVLANEMSGILIDVVFRQFLVLVKLFVVVSEVILLVSHVSASCLWFERRERTMPPFPPPLEIQAWISQNGLSIWLSVQARTSDPKQHRILMRFCLRNRA
jgi:hypothetical protein